MNDLQTLIDKAHAICGSDAELARRMGVSQSVISDMRYARRTITPESAAELAAVAGEDPLRAMALAVLARSKGTRREKVLSSILGGAFASVLLGSMLLHNVVFTGLTTLGHVYYV